MSPGQSRREVNGGVGAALGCHPAFDQRTRYLSRSCRLRATALSKSIPDSWGAPRVNYSVLPQARRLVFRGSKESTRPLDVTNNRGGNLFTLSRSEGVSRAGVCGSLCYHRGKSRILRPIAGSVLPGEFQKTQRGQDEALTGPDGVRARLKSLYNCRHHKQDEYIRN